jgi:4-hydroxy-tetrahydrodipicolinate reductase
MKICVAGACGRMGRRILELAAAAEDISIAGAVDLATYAGTTLTVGGESGKEQSVVVSADAGSEIAKSDVLIDFTVAGACVDHVERATTAGKPSVIGTTGLSDDQKMRLHDCAERTAIVFAPNMSVGVNLLFKLTGEVARILGLDYNIEIVETHHSLKKDSPSGTAMRLAERAAEALGLRYPDEAVFGRHGMTGERPARQIGVHAVRGGDVVGEHTVSFIGKGERIELTHKAHSRDNFARGALVAARFVLDARPGLYDMQDVLGL